MKTRTVAAGVLAALLASGCASARDPRARIDPTMLGLTDRSALPALRQTKINFELE